MQHKTLGVNILTPDTTDGVSRFCVSFAEYEEVEGGDGGLKSDSDPKK